jgi:hypothetical protein
MTVSLAARRPPRVRDRDALAAAALESLGEVVALVVDV